MGNEQSLRTAASPGTTADRGSAVPWRAMTWASVALAALVAKAEAGARVLREVMPTGPVLGQRPVRPRASCSATRPTPLNAWSQASHQFQRPVDLAERAGRPRRRVHCLLRRAGPGLPGPLQPRTASPGPAGCRAPRRRMAPAGVVAAVRAALANLIQDIIAVTAFCVWIQQHNTVPAGLAWALEAAVIAQWILVIMLAAWLLYGVHGDPDPGPGQAESPWR